MRSKDSQPSAHDEADDLEALASELGSSAPEEDVEDDVDLDRLAAVAGGRAPVAANGAETDAAASEKLDLSAKPVTERPPTPPTTAQPSIAQVAASEEPAGRPPPTAEPARRASNRVVPLLAVLAVGLGVLGYALGRSSQPQSAPVAAAPETAAPSPTAAPPAAPASPAEVAPPAPAPSVASAPVAATAPPTTRPADVAAPAPRPESRSKPAVSAAARSATTVPAPETEETEPAAEPAPLVHTSSSPEKEEDPPVAAKSSVDDLLDQALAGSGQRRADETTAPSELPESPSREEVTQTMAILLPAIRGCAMGQTGVATAGIVVRADGRVASVELSGAPFADTASGRCMEGVIRRARFSRFRKPTFRVRLPFAIQ